MQMLYGCRPYGEGSSQERVWSEGLIANAGEVNFPALPKVSDEARDLIRQCLTRDQRLRLVFYTVFTGGVSCCNNNFHIFTHGPMQNTIVPP